jgi:hypothetical protein
MTPTLRRLNDRERYWGLTWPGWIAAAAAGGVLYGAVKLSPFGFKPTVTIVALLIALFAMVLLGVSGQALSPGRQIQAIARYRRSPKRWELPDDPDRRGLVLAIGPADTADEEEVDAERVLEDELHLDDFVSSADNGWLIDQDAEEVLE